MDQQSHNSEAAPYKLPEVQVNIPVEKDVQESPQVRSSDEKQLAKAIEHGANGSGSHTPPLPVQAPPDTSMINPASGVNVVPQSVTKIQVSTDDLQAGDGDLIEKVWVVKAKAIVAQTKDDPFLQTNEIKRVKADYQLKRFNNKLKIENE